MFTNMLKLSTNRRMDILARLHATRLILAVGVICAVAGFSRADSVPRRVYVLHSGMHTILSDPWKNIAADTLRIELLRRGVRDSDIIVLDNPYPTASWSNMFPWGALTLFVGSTMPGSPVSQQNYMCLHKVLESRGVRPNDTVIWIGHSAGGQMGLTMAHLSSNLPKYPELHGKVSPYRFDMVITLGAPIVSVELPPEIRLRHYYSPQDKVVRLTCNYVPNWLFVLGCPMCINAFPPRLNQADRIRIFSRVEHPNWDLDRRVVDRIVRETNPDDRPLWQSPLMAPGLGMSLVRLVHHGLEMNSQITLEDPPFHWVQTIESE